MRPATAPSTIEPASGADTLDRVSRGRCRVVARRPKGLPVRDRRWPATPRPSRCRRASRAKPRARQRSRPAARAIRRRRRASVAAGCDGRQPCADEPRQPAGRVAIKRDRYRAWRSALVSGLSPSGLRLLGTRVFRHVTRLQGKRTAGVRPISARRCRGNGRRAPPLSGQARRFEVVHRPSSFRVEPSPMRLERVLLFFDQGQHGAKPLALDDGARLDGLDLVKCPERQRRPIEPDREPAVGVIHHLHLLASQPPSQRRRVQPIIIRS